MQNYKQYFREIYKKNTGMTLSEIDSEIDFVIEVLTEEKPQNIGILYELTTNSLHNIGDIISKRVLTKKPIQYILKKTFFAGKIYNVTEDTLIPRPETEFLVQECIKRAPLNSKKILDIGTGSGCIAVELAIAMKDCFVVASDISQKALDVAVSNALLYDVSEKVKFVKSDIFDNIYEKFDIIVSNPPYISLSDRDEVQDDVYDFEPHSALFADEDGFYFYNRIAKNGYDFLNQGGLIAFEIGWKQSEKISKILKNCGFSDINFTKDLDGINRVVSAVK